MRKIPVKNYVILAILFLLIVAATFYACNFYKTRYTKTYTSEMISFMTEIKEDDIDNYVLENPTVVLYLSDKTEESLKDQEKELKKLLTDNHIQSYFVYVNVEKGNGKQLEKFQKKYKLDFNYSELPIFIVFQDGTLKEIYNQPTSSIPAISDFLIRNEVIEEENTK